MDEIYISVSFCKAGDLFIGEWLNGRHKWLRTPYGTKPSSSEEAEIHHHLMFQEFKNMRFESVDKLEAFMKDIQEHCKPWFVELDYFIPKEWLSQYCFYVWSLSRTI